MRIGELAKRSGLSIDALRYYDKIGLLRPARRNPVSRFREYGEGAHDLLNLVRAAKLAGLSLPQIRTILAAARNGSACKTVLPLLDRKVEEVDQAIRALRELRARLRRALKRGFPRGKAAGCSCPILLRLYKGGGA
ncbi:MAG: MerR family transcriptional regulator [Planctomycetes bacterium]|nr:MerR family transcriptional regulator [Planctomycetota bacterium]